MIYENRNEALEFLYSLGSSLKGESKIVVCFATNLEYDLINLFGSERIRECTIIFGKSYLVGADWKRHRITFRDTIRHLPISVRELGELVGLEKLDRETKTKEEAKRYCLRDATITFRAAKFLTNTYAEFDISPKMTLASSAYNIWLKNFWKREIVYPEDDIVNLAKQCYYGGRTEPFAIGTYDNVTVIDANSMFPWAMIDKPLPLPWGLYERAKPLSAVSDLGIYHVSVSSPNLQIPSLPYRTNDGRLCFPIGAFDSYYTGEEINYALSIGYKVSILSGYKFLETCNPFDDYVAEMFVRKNSSRGPARLLYKLLLNALYGKFGQGGEKIVAMPLEDFAQLRDLPDDYTVWNGFAIYREEGPQPIWGNCVWPAFVTGRARIRLHQEISRVAKKAGRILYCDTDSIIFQGKNVSYPEKTTRPGSFELRGKYQRIIIAGKKEYGLLGSSGKWEIHIKGVPPSAREDYLLNGRASYVRPVRLKESARRNIQANVWIPFTKERKVKYGDRILNAAGDLMPISIMEKASFSRNKKG